MKVQRNSMSKWPGHHEWVIVARPVNDEGELVNFCEVGRIREQPLSDQIVPLLPDGINQEPYASQIAQILQLEFVDVQPDERGLYPVEK